MMPSTSIFLSLLCAAMALGSQPQPESWVRASGSNLTIDTRSKPRFLYGRFDNSGKKGIAIRVIDRNSTSPAILFCLDASKSSRVFLIAEANGIGFSSEWRLVKPREARTLQKDFEDYPQTAGDAIGMFWEGAGVALMFWNGLEVEYRILSLRGVIGQKASNSEMFGSVVLVEREVYAAGRLSDAWGVRKLGTAPLMAPQRYRRDAEDRMMTDRVQILNDVYERTYFYDGAGKRVRKVATANGVRAAESVYAYDATSG